jgi:biotin synthase
MVIRHNWTLGELQELHDLPLLDLVFRAASVHREMHNPREMQVSKLISVKTGGCPEDCAYCAQSSRYSTGVGSEKMMDRAEVLAIAERAKAAGVSRVCLGAAWRSVRDGEAFDKVVDMVRGVTDLGMEVCCTLGMLNENQARTLADAGLYAYNHNLDSSAEFYETIITTRSQGDRLATLENVRSTNVTVCSGGIIGMGESVRDRLELIRTLASLQPHPESVPINLLSQVEGTPLGDRPEVEVWDVLRMIAIARITMPASDVRLTAGRIKLSPEAQAFCFLAGANSIFSSDNEFMLTKAVPSPSYNADQRLLAALGMTMRAPFAATSNSRAAELAGRLTE